MFCHQCQLFWESVISLVQVSGPIRSCEDVRWTRYETVLHRSMRELKHSSDHRCPICRAILYTPTRYEHDSLLANDDEPLDIVLDIDPNKGPHPVLSVTFFAANSAEKVARVPKRILAAVGGLITDGERNQAVRRDLSKIPFR